MLSAKEAASKAEVSVSLVYCWVKAGALTHSRMGKPGKRGTIRIEEAALERFLTGLRREADERR